MFADAPSDQLTNLQSANHGGGGQNVLFQDGSVRYQKTCTLADLNNDHLFLNTDGKQEAGRGRDDTVLGRSEATPGLRRRNRRRRNSKCRILAGTRNRRSPNNSCVRSVCTVC